MVNLPKLLEAEQLEINNIPHNIEAEQAILGALLLNNDCYHRISDILRIEHFYDPVHADIYKKTVARITKDHLASPITMKTEMENHAGLKELGGPAYLVRLAGVSTTASAVREIALAVIDDFRRRSLLELLDGAIEGINAGEPIVDVEGGIEARLAVSVEMSEKRPIVSLGETVLSTLEEVSNAYRNDETGISTGIPELDEKVGGFRGGDFILIGGRPAMGKTALALSMLLGAARKGFGTAINSLEMHQNALAIRAISEVSGVPYYKARNGWIDEDQMRAMVEHSQELINLPIKIIPSHIRDIGAIYSSVKRCKSMFEDAGQDMGAVVIDYLQLIRSAKASRIDQIGEISMALKGMAMQLDVPVVALSQLSRAVESRDDKRPMMSDLRESGQLEQDADIIMFCYRDYYYLSRETPDFKDKKGNIDYELQADHEATMAECQHKMEIIVSKQRMGPECTVTVDFDAATNRVGARI